MIKKNRAEIVEFIIHKVGNKYNSTRNLLSDKPTFDVFDENSYQLAFNFLLKPFVNLTESYRFTHRIDVAENKMSQYSNNLFNNNEFVKTSQAIVEHLFEQSNSANIKTGDVMIVKFANIEINNILTDAIGIFKIENKSDFFQTHIDENGSIELMLLEGISTKKLDKGCLIINTTDNEGRIVLSVDSNNYDAQYWIKNFLNIKPADDSNGQTKNYMDFLTLLGEEAKNNFGKKKQSEFLAETLDYLKENETLNEDDFIINVLHDDDNLEAVFLNTKEQYEQEENIILKTNFIISDKVVKKEKKKFKTDIKLDTNITIKIDVDSPDAASYYLERGFDDEKKMFYYKVFFNEEK